MLPKEGEQANEPTLRSNKERSKTGWFGKEKPKQFTESIIGIKQGFFTNVS
jgi:hypothetical protein